MAGLASASAAKDETAVGAAEAEGVAQHATDVGALVLTQVVQFQLRVYVGRAQATRHQAFLNGKRADDRFQRARRTQGMSGCPFGRTAGGAGAKYRRDGEILGTIIADGGGAMQVDVVDVAGDELGRQECLLDRCACSSTFRVRA